MSADHENLVLSQQFDRILVADQRHEQRAVIEKSLGLLGYFRVGPVSTFEELIQLSHYSPHLYERFDLLIINADVIVAAGLNAADFCLNNSRFKHVLIRDSTRENKGSKTLSAKPNHHVRMVDAIDYETLEDFLSLVDKRFCRNTISSMFVNAA